MDIEEMMVCLLYQLDAYATKTRNLPIADYSRFLSMFPDQEAVNPGCDSQDARKSARAPVGSAVKHSYPLIKTV